MNQTAIQKAFGILNTRAELKRRAHPELAEMHVHSFRNRTEVRASAVCGCFSCLKVFPSQAISQWWDKDSGASAGTTAVCPHCGVDAVLGDQCGRALTDDLLAGMHQFWFGDSVPIDLVYRDHK